MTNKERKVKGKTILKEKEKDTEGHRTKEALRVTDKDREGPEEEEKHNEAHMIKEIYEVIDKERDSEEEETDLEKEDNDVQMRKKITLHIASEDVHGVLDIQSGCQN